MTCCCWRGARWRQTWGQHVLTSLEAWGFKWSPTSVTEECHTGLILIYWGKQPGSISNNQSRNRFLQREPRCPFSRAKNPNIHAGIGSPRCFGPPLPPPHCGLNITTVWRAYADIWLLLAAEAYLPLGGLRGWDERPLDKVDRLLGEEDGWPLALFMSSPLMQDLFIRYCHCNPSAPIQFTEALYHCRPLKSTKLVDQ